MAQKNGSIKFSVFAITILVAFVPFLCASSPGEKDPIKDTQTDPVPVTDELIKQEGEPGPASPSFKLKDSANFFSREPFDSDEELKEDQEEQSEKPDSLETDWLFGEKDIADLQDSESEPADQR